MFSRVTLLEIDTMRADVEASAGMAASAVEGFVTVYRAPPGREHYRVAYAEMPRVTVES